VIEHPEDEAGLVRLVGEAVKSTQRLSIEGAGTKRGFGPQTDADKTVSLTAMSGITLYEPEELVLSAKAGTPLSVIDEALAEQGQQLAFDPPNWCHLWHSDGTAQTIGGVLACGLSGPNRISAGAARDFVLGCHWVNGRAELMRSGGRVMKNVTGYDIPKLMVGSFGTLGIMTDVTLKVLPKPAFEATLYCEAGDAKAASRIMTHALSSPQAVSAAAYDAHLNTVFLRLEGTAVSVEDRLKALRDLNEGVVVEARASTELWAGLRDLTAWSDEKILWLISIPPSAMADFIARVEGGRVLADWGGGRIIFAGTDPLERITPLGGHRKLLRGSQTERRDLPFSAPLSKAEILLSEKLRQSFDPLGLFNPGRISWGAG